MVEVEGEISFGEYLLYFVKQERCDKEMSKMKRAIEKFQIDIKMKRLDLHFKRELENVRKKSPVEVKSLDSSQLKQINDFYNGFGFHGVDTRWHECFYAVTGGTFL